MREVRSALALGDQSELVGDNPDFVFVLTFRVILGLTFEDDLGDAALSIAPSSGKEDWIGQAFRIKTVCG